MKFGRGESFESFAHIHLSAQSPSPSQVVLRVQMCALYTFWPHELLPLMFFLVQYTVVIIGFLAVPSFLEDVIFDLPPSTEVRKHPLPSGSQARLPSGSSTTLFAQAKGWDRPVVSHYNQTPEKFPAQPFSGGTVFFFPVMVYH